MNSLEMTGRIGLRNLGRNRSRGIFIMLGVSFTVGICAVPWTMMGQMMPMICERYDYVEKYDIKIQLKSFREIDSAISEIYMNDVKKAEALIEIPVTFRKDNLSMDSVMVGVEPKGELYTPVDSTKRPVDLRSGQLSVTPNIAEKHKHFEGDYIYISSPLARYLRKRRG